MLQKVLVVGCVAALLSACGGNDSSEPTTTNEAPPATGAQPPSASTPTPAPQPAPDPNAPPPPSVGAPPPVAGPPTAALPPAAPAPAAGGTLGSCDMLAPMPTKPANAKSVAQFGVVPSDTQDQAGKIQAALDGLKPGDWLVFPVGKYLHSAALKVRVPNVTIWSEGATMVATNPGDTSFALHADGAKLYGFRLHTVTNARGSKLYQARIVLAPSGSTRVQGNVVRKNIIENGGAPGTPLANGSSASGIMVYRADGFLIAENTVKRTLADAIHITAGSRNGRVILNTVRENGDDMIAVVSYMGSPGTAPSTLAANLASWKAERLTRNIFITRNDVSGQYWGRGITVVGGEDVTIQNNKIANTTYGAAVLLSRDAPYLTYGVHNVLVRNNDIQHVQTTAPVYSIGNKATAPRTGHAGIEIYAQATNEEMQHPTIGPAVTVDRVHVENNTVSDTRADAIRVGVSSGKVGQIGLVNNRMSQVGRVPLNVLDVGSQQFNTFCSGNSDDGNPTSSNLCMGAKPAVTGASVTCGGA